MAGRVNRKVMRWMGGIVLVAALAAIGAFVFLREVKPPFPGDARMESPPAGIRMLDARNGYGWSAAHPAAVTQNGGAAWYDVTPCDEGIGTAGMLKGYFVDARTGWVFDLRPGEAVTVYGTRDGGGSWTVLAEVPVKYGDGNMYVTFADARRGWFLEITAGMGQHRGELFATADGGRTWTKVTETGAGDDGLPFGGRITAGPDGSLWLSGGQRAVMSSGGPGFIWFFQSIDKGETWTQVKLPVPVENRGDMTTVSAPFFFGRAGLVSVLYTSGRTMVYGTDDGGTTWEARGTAPVGAWPVFADAVHGWQTDGRSLYRTGDGGRTWRELPEDAVLGAALSAGFISQLDFVDARHGWAVVEESPLAAEPVLLATDDGGMSWERPSGR